MKKIDIQEVLSLQEKLNDINSEDLSSIEFYDGDQKIDIDDRFLAECGEYKISVSQFISMYLKKS